MASSGIRRLPEARFQEINRQLAWEDRAGREYNQLSHSGVLPALWRQYETELDSGRLERLIDGLGLDEVGDQGYLDTLPERNAFWYMVFKHHPRQYQDIVACGKQRQENEERRAQRQRTVPCQVGTCDSNCLYRRRAEFFSPQFHRQVDLWRQEVEQRRRSRAATMAHEIESRRRKRHMTDQDVLAYYRELAARAVL